MLLPGGRSGRECFLVGFEMSGKSLEEYQALRNIWVNPVVRGWFPIGNVPALSAHLLPLATRVGLWLHG